MRFLKNFFLYLKKNKWIINFFKIIITVIIFYLLFHNINIKNILSKIKYIKIKYLILNILISLIVTPSLLMWRLKLLFDYNKIKINFFYLLRMHYISLFFQIIFPSSFASDAIKIYYLRNKEKISKVSVIVFLSRFLGVFTVILLSAIFSIIYKDFYKIFSVINISKTLYIKIIFLLFIFLAMILLFIKPFSFFNIKRILKSNIFSKIQKIETVYNQKVLLIGIFISILIQFIMAVTFFLYGKSCNIDFTFYKLILYSPLIILLTLLIPSVNGIGVREFLLYKFFKPEIGNIENLFLISFEMLIVISCITVVGGILYWLKRK